MNWKKSNEKKEQNDSFCKKCGNEQNVIMIDKETEDTDFLDDGIESESNLFVNNDSGILIPDEKESLVKKVFKGLGTGGLIVGGGFLFLSLTVLRFLFIATVGLSMVWQAISLFSSGSIIYGLVVLLIGTPIAIGFAGYSFIFLFFLTIIALIIWGFISLFGFDVTFSNIWDDIWFVIKVFVLGVIVFFGIIGLIQSIKDKEVSSFFKENWFYIPLFFFLLWLFF